MISLIHPSRSRIKKSRATMYDWNRMAKARSFEIIVSVDQDDPEVEKYKTWYEERVIINKNRSAVDAINNAAKVAKGDILIVVSDDTEPIEDWDLKILKESEGKTDWILKTQDGIQPWIITMPIMDRAYYNRTSNIYHPDFEHQFADTWLTCLADISGRKITSDLLFPHLNDSIKDDLRKRTDATWQQGEKVFLNLVNKLPVEDLRKIKDGGMINWLKAKRVHSV